MDIESLKALRTEIGLGALYAAEAMQPKEEFFLSHFTSLQKKFPAPLARTALEIAILRLEAIEKFGDDARHLFFTRQALEQATSREVSKYRSKRFENFSMRIDLGCSVGCDTLALAQYGPTIGVDKDPLRLALATANFQAFDLDQRVDFIQADLMKPLPLKPNEDTALFFDPARRSGHKRLFSVEAYQPPLSIIQDWIENFPAIGVKVSPGVKLEEINHLGAEIEFISLNGELKEAALWFGPLRTIQYRATILPGPHTLFTHKIPPSSLVTKIPLSYLYEPDPAILRAGLVTLLGEMLQAKQLDPEIAYLSSDILSFSKFARVWVIEDWMPFNLKKLRAYLREKNVGKVTIKKRGSPLLPEEVIQSLRLRGDLEKTLILTKLKGAHIVIICRPQPLKELG